MKTTKDPVPSQAQRSIHDQLRTMEEIIRSLHEQIGFYREQNRTLLEERKALLKLRSRLDALRGERGEVKTELDLLRRERDDLGAGLRNREVESRDLAHRCATLEAALRAERDKTAELREVIVCLESQIEQLETMVHLLQEHQEIRRVEERLAEYQRALSPSEE